jgi:hypothetical protein
MKTLSRELGASTERMLEVNLPKVLQLDAANNADELTFSIRREWLPMAMYKKAAKNLTDPFKYVKVVKPDPTESPDLRWYYVLSQSQTKYSSVTDILIAQYEGLRQGYKPAGTAGKYERCVEIMQALHKVEELDDDDPRIVPNPTNPFNLWCHICKAFAMLGTCSHVITVTDMLMQARPEAERCVECDVQKMLMLVDANNKSLAGASKLSKANSEGRRLNKKAVVEVGKFSSKKNQSYTERREKKRAEKALEKACEKKAQRERAAVAKKLIGKKTKKPAAKKTKKPVSQKKAKPRYDSSDEDSSDEDY